MNIVQALYSFNVTQKSDFFKLLKDVKIKTFRNDEGYFIDAYTIQTSIGHRKIIGIDVDAFNILMFNNIETVQLPITHIYKNRKDAVAKKWLLCVLLLEIHKDIYTIKEVCNRIVQQQ